MPDDIMSSMMWVFASLMILIMGFAFFDMFYLQPKFAEDRCETITKVLGFNYVYHFDIWSGVNDCFYVLPDGTKVKEEDYRYILMRGE